MNTLGLVTALSTFAAIWLGHISVRKIEAIAPVLELPIAGAVLLGLACAGLSLSMSDPAWAAALGIFGITFLWDALEFKRQQRRVQRGHAPANPANPRHAAYLQAGRATTAHLLRREPSGKPVPAEQARQEAR
jgi:hypothetical protein